MKTIKEQLTVTGRNFFQFPMWTLTLISINDKSLTKAEVYKDIYHKFNCGNYNYIYKVCDILEKYKLIIIKDRHITLTEKGKQVSDKAKELYNEVSNVKIK